MNRDSCVNIVYGITKVEAIVSNAQQRTEELRPAQVHEVWGGTTAEALHDEYNDIFPVWGGTTAEALHDEYNDIFPKTNNSNAASHVWSSSVLRRSMQLQPSQIRELVSGRCFVSGSPVSPTQRPPLCVTICIVCMCVCWCVCMCVCWCVCACL